MDAGTSSGTGTSGHTRRGGGQKERRVGQVGRLRRLWELRLRRPGLPAGLGQMLNLLASVSRRAMLWSKALQAQVVRGLAHGRASVRVGEEHSQGSLNAGVSGGSACAHRSAQPHGAARAGSRGETAVGDAWRLPHGPGADTQPAAVHPRGRGENNRGQRLVKANSTIWGVPRRGSRKLLEPAWGRGVPAVAFCICGDPLPRARQGAGWVDNAP